MDMGKFRADAVIGGKKVTAQAKTNLMYPLSAKPGQIYNLRSSPELLKEQRKPSKLDTPFYNESRKQVYTVKTKGFQTSNLKGVPETDKSKKMAPLCQDCMKKTGTDNRDVYKV